MSDAIPHDRDFRPVLTARREDAYIPIRAITTQLSPRGLVRHFARRGERAGVRPATPPRQVRRVMVKVRPMPHVGNARSALAKHLRYIERDGAGPDGEEVRLFNGQSDDVDRHDFASASSADRHHFRLMVNPEDGRDLPDLKAFCRRFIERVEQDLGTSLEWAAGAHHDTGRPHIHLVIRGVRDDGSALKLPRDYILDGMRRSAMALATDVLGPRPERFPNYLATQDRFTPLDRLLIDTAVAGKLDRTTLPPHSETDALRRLGYLEGRGWVQRESANVWSVSGLRRALYTVRERAVRETAAAQILSESGLKRSAAELVPVEPMAGDRLTGGFVGCRFVGPFAGGAHVVLIDLHDGRLGHLRMPDTASVLCLDRMPEGAVVRIAAIPRAPRPSDLTVAEVAQAQDGVWSPGLHAASRLGDSPAFIQRHAKRVEALAREGACIKLEGGGYLIPTDYVTRALESDTQRWGPTVPRLHVLDHRSLTDQIQAGGATWLDRILAGATHAEAADGPGGVVHHALTTRSLHLRSIGLGRDEPFKLSSAEVELLGMREIEAAFKALSADSGKPVFLADKGDAVTGIYKDRLHLSSVPYAVVEGEGAITLVKWRPGLESCRGQAIVGTLGQAGLEFRTARAVSRGLGLEL